MKPFKNNPLARMVLTQPFGVNWTGDPLFYKKDGLLGHDGIDLSAAVGTPVYAVFDGPCYVKDMVSGYGKHVRQRNESWGLEVIYAHGSDIQVADGTSAAPGQQIMLSGATGDVTGPHLHFEVRPITWHPDGSGPYDLYPDNGYGGAVDPLQFFEVDPFQLPVDVGYSDLARASAPSVFAFAPAFLYFLQTQRRGPTKREYNALRYGRWDLRTVLDPSMFDVWSKFTKPTAKANGLIP